MNGLLQIVIIVTIIAVAAVLANGMDKIERLLSDVHDEQRQHTDLLRQILDAQSTEPDSSVDELES